jgi:hypothetical protein
MRVLERGLVGKEGTSYNSKAASITDSGGHFSVADPLHSPLNDGD